MKKTIVALTLIFGAALTACVPPKDNGDGKAAVYAQTPQACNLPGSSNCNPGVYSQYPQFQPYIPEFQSYQYGYINGFCGCQSGYRPVMNAQWGLSCAPNNWFPTSQYYQGYSAQSVYLQAQNNHWTAIPQITYSPAVSGGTANCHAQAAAACDVRNPNNCSGGGICRPVSGASTIGICTYGSGNESYANPNQCWQSTGYGWRWICAGQNQYPQYQGGQQLPR